MIDAPAALAFTSHESVIAGLIFLASYLVLAVGRSPGLRIDRTGAAVVGGILMVVIGGLPLDAAFRAIDYRTLILLFGMMMLVASLKLARFFETIAQVIARAVRHPMALLVTVVFASGLLSALFVNDTICLVFTPVLIEIAEARGHRALPYLLALATASNIGSSATITGNPQNMLIGSLSHIPFTTFTLALAPIALVGLAIDAVVLVVLFRGTLSDGEVATIARGGRPIHRALLIKSLIVAGAVLAGFLAGLDTALVAAAGAGTVLITRRVKPDKLYRQVDWDLLMLFVGLFVIVAGIERVGIDRAFFDWLRPIGITSLSGLTFVATVLSNVISNVPAVMLFTHVVPLLPDPSSAWLALAMSSTLAGNLTILGSVANLIVVEGARRRGIQISFMDYLKVGLPVTVGTLAFGVWWLAR